MNRRKAMNGPDAFSHLYDLIKQDRMEAMRYVSEGLSSQMIDPLSAIRGRADRLRNQLSHDQQESIETIIAEIDKMVDLLKDMSATMKSNPGMPVATEFYLKDVCDLIVGFVNHRLIKNQISCRVDISNNLKMNIDSSRVKQILVALIVNAVEAIEENIRLNHSETRQIFIEARKNSQELVISISDTGCGIKPSDVDKIFSPLYSTKPRPTGKGIGLSMANKFAEEIGGKIAFYSNEGIGSTFELKLPLEVITSAS